MSRLVVADAGPLIALARTGHLGLLRELFEIVLVPQAVLDELHISSNRAGARRLAEAVEKEQWIQVRTVQARAHALELTLGKGETEAILLAIETNAILLMDDKRGRAAARLQSIDVIGTGRVLVTAKRGGLLESVTSGLDDLAGAGYRMSPALRRTIIELAGEQQ